MQERLTGLNALAAPFVFDIRGGGGFWGIEFDLTGSAAASLNFKGEPLAMAIQARALENGLIVMSMTGVANLEGTQGDVIILAPAYNVTKEEIDKIVEVFVESVEEVLEESGVV